MSLSFSLLQLPAGEGKGNQMAVAGAFPTRITNRYLIAPWLAEPQLLGLDGSDGRGHFSSLLRRGAVACARHQRELSFGLRF